MKRRPEEYWALYHTYNYRLAGRMWQLYVNNPNKYLVCRDGEIYQPKVKANGRPQCLTMKKIQGHIGCYFNVAVFASEKSAKFICFDVDVMDKELVLRLIDILVGFGFRRDYIYPSISGGKGYHVEIFFDKPVANEGLAKLYRAVIEEGDFDRSKVEFRPTPTQGIRLPLSEHYKTGVRGWYCNAETLAPIETTDYLFEIKQMTRERFDRLIKKIKLRPNGIRKSGYRIDGPKYVGEYTVPVLREPHTRHNTMVSYARTLRWIGCNMTEIYNRLMDWVDEQDRTYINSTDEEIEEDAQLIAQWAMTVKGAPTKQYVERHYGKATLGAADLNYILNGRTKNGRRILFRSVLSQKIFGQDHTAQDIIGHAIEVTEQTAKARIKELVQRGVLKKFDGKRYNREVFGFGKTANSYTPGDNIEDILDPEDFAGEWALMEKITWKNCLWYYAAAMTTMLGDKLAKYVGTREANEIKAILAGGRKVETEAWGITQPGEGLAAPKAAEADIEEEE